MVVFLPANPAAAAATSHVHEYGRTERDAFAADKYPCATFANQHSETNHKTNDNPPADCDTFATDTDG